MTLRLDLASLEDDYLVSEVQEINRMSDQYSCLVFELPLDDLLKHLLPDVCIES